jgi:hypothetical protein
MALSPLAALFTTQYAPVQSAMLAHLDVGEIVALSRTCKAIAPIWKTFIATSFDINRLLGEYFRDPKAFRSLQANHGVLIVEDVVRQFFARRTEGVHRLRLLVNEKEYPGLHTYLESEGYSFHAWAEYIKIFHYEQTGDDGVRRKIVIAATDGHASPLSTLLLKASTTASLAFISWDNAYCLFPSATLIHHHTFLIHELNDGMAKQLVRLTEEGLRTQSVAWNSDKTSKTSKALTCPRRVGDKYTWVIGLPTEGLKNPLYPCINPIIKTATFQLQAGDYDRSRRMSRYVVKCKELTHPVLRHPLLVLQVHHRARCQPYDDLLARLEEMTRMEMMKIPVDKRPPQYAQLVVGQVKACDLRGTFELPATWTFYDEDVATYMAEVWEKLEIEYLNGKG